MPKKAPKKEKNPMAVWMAKRRWRGTTKAQRRAISRKLNAIRWGKKVA